MNSTYGCEQAKLAPSLAKRLTFQTVGSYDLGARVRFHAVDRELAKLPVPRRVLDAGSGRGELSFAMHRRWPKAEILGVDFEPELVEHTRHLVSLDPNPLPMTFERRTLPDTFDRTFDVVTCIDVLEHIDDDLGFLAGLRAATAPGGRLVLHTPAAPQRRYLAEFEEQHDHVRDGYAEHDLRALLERAGFTVETVRKTFGRAGAIGWEGFALARQGNKFAAAGLPLWYALSAIDALQSHRTGNGLLIVGRAR